LTTPLVTNAGTLALSATGANIVTASTNGVERLRIDSAGNVGIGLTNPSSYPANANNLVVGGEANSGITIASSSATGNTGLYFTDTPFAAKGIIAYSHTDNAFQFFTGGTNERLRIDSAGNVGIGRTTTIGTNCRLNVQLSGTSASGYTAASNAGIALDCGTATNGIINLVGGGDLGVYRSNTSGAFDVGIGFGSNADRILRFDTAGSERARIDATGNFMVGTTTPASSSQTSSISTSGVFAAEGPLADHTTSKAILEHNSNVARIRAYGATAGTGVIAFNTGGGGGSADAERARIDASGNLLVGTTTQNGEGGLSVSPLGSNGAPFVCWNRAATSVTSTAAAFRNGGTDVGLIQYTNTATSYVTSSDYRLKKDVQPMVGSVDRLMALKPVNFAWKVDGSRVDGFLAHEAQEVVPECVTGEKDAVDKDGKPVYQGIDQSKLAPLLVAALQEALQKIEALEARITALEA
jgi:hypothetical protein